METGLEISCPYCDALNMVNMKVMEGQNRVAEIVSTMLPDVKFKQYSFYGITKCVCGETINAILTVGGGKKL